MFSQLFFLYSFSCLILIKNGFHYNIFIYLCALFTFTPSLHFISPSHPFSPLQKSPPVVFRLSWCLCMCITSKFLFPSVSSFSSLLSRYMYTCLYLYLLQIYASSIVPHYWMFLMECIRPLPSPTALPPVGKFFPGQQERYYCGDLIGKGLLFFIKEKVDLGILFQWF